jgi:hypothetical protein
MKKLSAILLASVVFLSIAQPASAAGTVVTVNGCEVTLNINQSAADSRYAVGVVFAQGTSTRCLGVKGSLFYKNSRGTLVATAWGTDTNKAGNYRVSLQGQQAGTYVRLDFQVLTSSGWSTTRSYAG